MVSSLRPDIRCQLCGVSGNVGRMRLASEPPEAAARRRRRGVPLSNETGCVGCFVVTDGGAEDDEDAADASFIPEDVEPSKDDKYEYMPTPRGITAEDCLDDMFGDDDDDDDYNDSDSEMDTGGGNKESYTQFLRSLPSENCNTIVPLTEAYKERDQTWCSREHISGPNCQLTNAYLGRNITAEELRGCNTFQLLCPKPSDWAAEPGDEDFELDEACPSYLSGLRDHLDATSNTSSVFAPLRHGQEQFSVHNWARDASSGKKHASMPFHPACFEVFKRASLQRCSTVDVRGLAGWYQVESSAHYTDKIFPHDPAVRRATKGGAWEHEQGDEWIAANPCFVPALEEQMRELDTEEPFKGSCLGRSRSVKEEEEQALEEIAQVHLSSEAAPSPSLSQSFYYGHIRREMPWIWEAWCARPYSGWASRSQSEIARDPLAVSHQRDYLRNWIKTLEEADGDGDRLPSSSSSSSSTQKRAQLRDLRAQVRDLEAGARFTPAPQPATRLARHGTDWRKLYFALRTLGETCKGLRNRERVWRCCHYILDRIEMQRGKGRIRANDSVMSRLPADEDGGETKERGWHRGLDFASDYSESEAEFSDEDAMCGDDEDMEMGG